MTPRSSILFNPFSSLSLSARGILRGGWITATASGFSLILCFRGKVLKPVVFIQLLLVLVNAENNRQPLYRTHSANHIANYKIVNLADLQKQISDLKELVCSHVIKTTNKQDERYNSVFPDFSKAGHNTSRCISKNKRRKNRRNASEKRRTAKKRELNEKFLKNFQTISLPRPKLACYQGANVSLQPWPTKRKLRDNSRESLNFSRDECASNTSFTDKIKNHIFFMSNRIGCLRFNNLLPLKTI